MMSVFGEKLQHLFSQKENWMNQLKVFNLKVLNNIIKKSQGNFPNIRKKNKLLKPLQLKIFLDLIIDSLHHH